MNFLMSCLTNFQKMEAEICRIVVECLERFRLISLVRGFLGNVVEFCRMLAKSETVSKDVGFFTESRAILSKE